MILSPPFRVLGSSLRRQARTAGLGAAAGGLFGLGGVLLPDSTGRISHMALQFGNCEFDQPLPQTVRKAVLNVWSILFREMDPRTRFTVVAADRRNAEDVRELARKCGAAARVRVLEADSTEGMSIWIRDSMLPVSGPSGDTLLLVQRRTYYPGPDDRRAPELLGTSGRGLSVHPHAALCIDGGNVVSNRREAVVGIDSIRQTRDRLRELASDPEVGRSLEDFCRRRTGGSPGKTMWDKLPKMLLENELGKRVLVIGQDDPKTPKVREEQPAFHVDMFATPIGDDRFLVGDPGLAIRTLEALDPKERKAINRKMCEEAGLAPDRDLIGDLIEENRDGARQANFDNVSRQLARGHQVERVPCLLGRRFSHSLPYLTYNNCMMEDYVGEDGHRVRKVYLPMYGCEPLDRMARETYERQGFQVVALPMAAITVYEGAIRCSSYALRREAR